MRKEASPEKPTVASRRAGQHSVICLSLSLYLSLSLSIYIYMYTCVTYNCPQSSLPSAIPPGRATQAGRPPSSRRAKRG